MKLNLRKIAIPVIVAGVIIYGGSKIGKINNNEDYKNNTDQIEYQQEMTLNNNKKICQYNKNKIKLLNITV